MKRHWMITGAGGQFGSVLLRHVLEKGDSALGLVSHRGPQPFSGETRRVDLLDQTALAGICRQASPQVIVHAAAVTRIDRAFQEPDLTRRTNVESSVLLRDLAVELKARILFISTDLVFDGSQAPYDETAQPAPLSVYGRSKRDAEKQICAYERGIVLRLPLMYGVPEASRETTFLRQISSIRKGTPLRLFTDEFRTPIALADASSACIEAAESELHGILHAGGPQRLSRFEMGRIMATAMGESPDAIIASRQCDVDFAEKRPADVSLDSNRFEREFGHAPGKPMQDAMMNIALQLGAH